MNVEQRAVERIRAMLEKANALRKTYRAPPSNYIGFEGWVDATLFSEWRTQSLVVLTQILGSEHQYTRSFEAGTKKRNMPSSVSHGMGVLQAVAEDLASGHLFDIRRL